MRPPSPPQTLRPVSAGPPATARPALARSQPTRSRGTVQTVSHNLGLSASDIAVAGSNPARQHSGTAEIFEGVNNSHSGYRPGTVG